MNKQGCLIFIFRFYKKKIFLAISSLLPLQSLDFSFFFIFFFSLQKIKMLFVCGSFGVLRTYVLELATISVHAAFRQIMITAREHVRGQILS